jgi:hypothetical protein
MPVRVSTLKRNLRASRAGIVNSILAILGGTDRTVFSRLP